MKTHTSISFQDFQRFTKVLFKKAYKEQQCVFFRRLLFTIVILGKYENELNADILNRQCYIRHIGKLEENYA